MKSDVYKKTPSRKTTEMYKEKIYIEDDYDDEEDLLIDVIGDDMPHEMILGFEHLIEVDLSDSDSNYSQQFSRKVDRYETQSIKNAND